jgi:Winged helix DNA-binding domain
MHMEPRDIANARLVNQHIDGARLETPVDVLASMGAIQGQDYLAGLWAIGLRCKAATQKDVEEAIAKRKIVRSWLLRGTLQFAASADVRWILRVIYPRLTRHSLLSERRLKISSETVTRSQLLISEALKRGGRLEREKIYRILEDGGITTGDAHGYHLLRRAAWDGLICLGTHDGRRPTFVLLDDWVAARGLDVSADEALMELALRYFTSHGPATLKDYVQWSGLRISDAKKGITLASSSRLVTEEVDGKTYFMARNKTSTGGASSVHLLPTFDEYVLGYNDRSAILGNEKRQQFLNAGKITFAHPNGIFLSTIVIDGQIVGTWRHKNEKGRSVLTIIPYLRLGGEETEGVERAAERYGRFVGTQVLLKWPQLS